MSEFRSKVRTEEIIVEINGASITYDINDEAGITHTFEYMAPYYKWLLNRKVPFKFVWDKTEESDSRSTTIIIHYYIEFEKQKDQLMFELIWKGRYHDFDLHEDG